MKKVMIALVLCIVSTICFAQEKIGDYQCKYFDTEYPVHHSDGQGYMIGIHPDRANTMVVTLSDDKVSKFCSALTEFRAKYIEWCNVAKENNVDKLDKKMDIKFPTVGVAWIGSKAWIDPTLSLEPRFLISDGKYLCLLLSGKKVSAYDNEYITEKAYWVFSSADEIDELLSLLNGEALQKMKQEQQKTDDLFH